MSERHNSFAKCWNREGSRLSEVMTPYTTSRINFIMVVKPLLFGKLAAFGTLYDIGKFSIL